MARKKLARENSPMIDIPGPSPANAQSPERENANSAVRESGIPLAVPAPPTANASPALEHPAA